MQLEHYQVEKEMPRPRPCTDAEVAQQDPQLKDGTRTNRRNGKEADLQDTTAPTDKPVRTTHVHQYSVNSLFLSSFEMPTEKVMNASVQWLRDSCNPRCGRYHSHGEWHIFKYPR
jgi:hypothetical protein